MSRIGKKPIPLPAGVKVQLSGPDVTVTGPKGTLRWSVPQTIAVKHDPSANRIEVARSSDQKQSMALHGLSRALIANMVRGVTNGYEKRLLIYGTGYGCKLAGKVLNLNVGFSGRARSKGGAQFEIPIPDGLSVEVEVPVARGETEPAKFVVRGTDKQLLGQFCAEVRKLRPPEPYKGKGLRYENEYVRRKQGKAFASGGTS
jgi:large subunit ribosomal protein L6